MFIEWITALVFGYGFGCIQTSYFISNWVNKTDIREMGSGNAGASNVTTTMGFHFGILTGIVDIMKAYCSVISVAYLFPESTQLAELEVLAGSAAIMGHIFPFFMNFKGGKGIACYLGMIAALDIHAGMNVFLFLFISTVITDYISVGSILLYFAVPLFVLLSPDYSFTSFLIFTIIGIIGVFKHWINVQRILAGEETGLRSILIKEKN